MEYLSLKTIRSLKDNIKHEMESLISNKALITKPHSLQWLFFNDCLNKLFNPRFNSEFIKLPSVRTAQFKFEVEDKLRRFYLRPGRDIKFVFKIIHKKELKTIYFDEPKKYPDVGGYSILIRDTSKEINAIYSLTESDIKDYIERVVAEAIEMEFQAYLTLPEIIEDEELNKCYCQSCPAKREIMHVILRHKERGWVITNWMNPSTYRVISMKVKKIDKNEIFVFTLEYWYLRWWNTRNNSYTYPYRETLKQQYILRKNIGSGKFMNSLDRHQELLFQIEEDIISKMISSNVYYRKHIN